MATEKTEAQMSFEAGFDQYNRNQMYLSAKMVRDSNAYNAGWRAAERADIARSGMAETAFTGAAA